jgi:outer membrane protein
MNKTNLVATLSCLSVLMLPIAGHAYEKGDIIFRAGPAMVDPDSSSGLINLGGSPLAGTEVQVQDDTQLGLTLSYMLNPNWAVELLASTPFEHKITETGVGVNRVGSAKHLPPTLTAQYYPMGADSVFQPYLGIGVNYTTFFSEKTAGELDGALGKGDLSLDDSFGLALQAGADYAIGDNWLLNLSVWYIDIETDAKINTPAGRVTVDVGIDPMVYMFGLGYKF